MNTSSWTSTLTVSFEIYLEICYTEVISFSGPQTRTAIYFSPFYAAIVCTFFIYSLIFGRVVINLTLFLSSKSLIDDFSPSVVLDSPEK